MTTSGQPGALGAYSLSRLLGKNSLAETYLGEERASQQPVVVKLFTVSLSGQDRLRLVETLRAAAHILHPGLVRILGAGLHESFPFLVTEYAASGSLRQRYPQGTSPRPEMLLSMVEQLGAALQHLHRQGLFHLNLKPENILLRDDGSLMLCDGGWLGLPPLWHHRLTGGHESAAYLAPEQLLGLPVAASDQYALACLLYEWLSGQPPFVGSFREVCLQHLHLPPPPLNAPVPAELASVLRRALDKDPGRRFPSVKLFVEACLQAMRREVSQPVIPPASPAAAATPSALTHRPLPSSAPTPAEQALHPQDQPVPPVEQGLKPLPVCRLCRQPLPASGALRTCPACGYPADLGEELRFLEQLTAELSGLVQAGAAAIRLGDLARLSVPSLLALRREAHFSPAFLPLVQALERYRRRLREVQQLMAAGGQTPDPASSPAPALNIQPEAQRLPQSEIVLTSAAPPAGPASRPAPEGEAGTEAASPLDDTLVRKALKPPQRAGQPSAPPPPASQTARTTSENGQQQPQRPDSDRQAAALAQSSLSGPANRQELAGVGRLPGPLAQAPAATAGSQAAPARPPLPPRLARSSRSSPIATLRPLVESPVALMVALGTFLLLAALLVFHIANRQYALPVTLCAQVFFASMIAITGRSRHFREFRGIYALFFALTVPLLFPDLGFLLQQEQYRPWLLALTALYAAVTYGVLAVSQRFSPFAILCTVALVVAATSLVWAIAPGSWGWWVASGWLVLALLEAEALTDAAAARRSPLARLLHTSWDVLRTPLALSSQVLGYGVASLAGLLGFLLLLFLWIVQPSPDTPLWANLFSIPLTLLLAQVWLVRVGQHLRQGALQYPLIALLALTVPLVCSLAFPTAARLASGLGLLGLVACLDGYARLASPASWPYLRPGRVLTVVRYGLVLPISFLTVLQPQVTSERESLLAGAATVLLSAGLLLLMVLFPASVAAEEGEQLLRPRRLPWLQILPAGMALWGYAALGQAIAWAGLSPLWWLGLFCGGLIGLSCLVRPWSGRDYSAPWEAVVAVALGLLLLLIPVQGTDSDGTLVPLLLGAAIYAVLVAQRRSLWLWLPGLLLLVGLAGLAKWIADVDHLVPNAWAVILLAGSLLLPVLAALLHRFLPANPTLRLRLTPQVWQSERLLVAWEWDWPLTVLALGTGLGLAALLIADEENWSRAALAGITAIPLIQELAASGWLAVAEALAAGLMAYLAGWWARTRLWLAPAALFALVALWLIQDEFWALTAVVMGTAAVGMAVSRLKGRRWAIPWYVAGLFSLLLVMWHSLPPKTYSAFVLLALAGVVSIVGLVEGLPEVLWLVPLLLLEAATAALFLKPDSFLLPSALLVPALVPLSALVGLALGVWQSRDVGRRGSFWRWRWALPWYAGGLVGIATTSVALSGELWTQPPVLILSQAGPYLLLGFACIVTLVGLLEQAPELLWLAPALVLETCILLLRDLFFPNPFPAAGSSWLLPLLAPGCSGLGLLLSRLGQQRRELRLRRALPWYGAALLALGAVSLALFWPAAAGPWGGNPYLPLGYAALLTIIAGLEGAPAMLWLVPLLLLETCAAALLPAGRTNLALTLLVPALVPLSALMGLALGWWQRLRWQPAHQPPQDPAAAWLWSLPWYTGSLLAMGATSLALFGDLWSAPSVRPLSLMGPYLLLGFGSLSVPVALIEALPEILWLLPLLAVLATVAAQQKGGSDLGSALLMPGLVLLCTFVALGTSRTLLGRLDRSSSPVERWLRLRLVAPWYTTAAIAALATATFPFVSAGFGWAGTVAFLLLGYALLAWLVAVLERWPLAALATSIFGLWALGKIALVEQTRGLLLPVVLGVLFLSLLADRRPGPAIGRGPGASTSAIRPSWALGWVPLLVVGWSILGLQHPEPFASLPAPEAWSAALAAFLIYGSGLLLRQVGVCWLAIPLALEALLQLGINASAAVGREPDMQGLAVFCLLSSACLASGAILERRWPLRAYVFPLLAANCAGVLALGIAGSLSSDPQRILLASALLLGYGLLIWLLALGLGLALLTLLTGLWSVWGLALLAGPSLRGQLSFLGLSFGKDQAVIIVGSLAALLGLLGLRRRRKVPGPTPKYEEKAA
ncbi:protein kinase [Thermogemmatispora sp.]|uniref:protein kinase domain-containing protein n=1 Tax=Thermogemmatispora sp. TaxID=1968838 RepID=UPI0035E446BA